MRGAAGSDPAHHEPVAGFDHVEPEPGARRPVHAPLAHELVEDRHEDVRGHDHVRRRRPSGSRLGFDEKRADAHELAVGTDEPGSAPMGMGGGGEIGLFEEIFPIAREFVPREQPRLDRGRGATARGEDHGIAEPEGGTAAESEAGDRQAPEKEEHAEAGHEIVAQEVRFHRPAFRSEPHPFGLGHEITDGDREATAFEQHRAAFALGAEDRGGERVLGHLGAQADDRLERALEVEVAELGSRPQDGRDRPIGLVAHARTPGSVGTTSSNTRFVPASIADPLSEPGTGSRPSAANRRARTLARCRRMAVAAA